MLRSAALLACLLTTPLARAGPTAPRTDRYGDPLPEGAHARLGSVRFRHAGGVRAIAYFPDGRHLASLGYDSKACVWDAATGRPLGEIQITDRSFECLTVSADGQRVFLGGPTGVSVWEWSTQHLRSFPIDNDSIVGLALADRGTTLVAQDREGHLRLWSLAAGRIERTIPVFNDLARVFGLAADGRTLVAVAPDGTAVVWDIADGTELRRLRPPDGRRLNRVTISADGSRIVGTFERGAEDSSLAVWETATGRLVRSLPLPKLTQQSALCLGMSADGKEVVTADSSNRARVWNLAAGRPSPEARRRLEAMVAGPPFLRDSLALRTYRSVQVLERIGSPAAKGVLRTLAEGFADAPITRDARAALARLDRAETPKP